MSRYRPPAPPQSKYITPEGHRALTEELDYLWLKLRPEVTRALSAAAAEGDRSENAEYIYRKKQLREIDSRVRHLRKRLEGMKIVSDPPTDKNKVYFGAWVTVVNENDEEKQYRIVGPDELDPKKNYISMDSPMGKAMIGKSLHEEFDINLPEHTKTFFIESIKY